ncbi:MAG: hypothetical protein KDC71_19465, partial [Acidobacteria bacterium]|nr:hypothetical protein [Acidobacteriota bacterium]
NRQENLPGRIQCPNRKPECGLVGAWVIDKTTLIGIKAKDPSQVMIMNLQEETWKVSITKYPLIDTHLIEPQSLRVRDSYIYLLARETWRLVRAPLNELLEGSGQNLQFEVVADLSFLHALFPHPNKKMDQAGYLESFDWGPNGNLWVLINPRGQDFSYSPDGDPKTAKLIEFEAIKP